MATTEEELLIEKIKDLITADCDTCKLLRQRLPEFLPTQVAVDEMPIQGIADGRMVAFVAVLIVFCSIAVVYFSMKRLHRSSLKQDPSIRSPR